MTKNLRLIRSFISPALLAGGLLLSSSLACSPLESGAEAKMPEVADAWYQRASAAYLKLDLAEAYEAVQKAEGEYPNNEKIRILAAKIALAELDFERAIAVLSGIPGTDGNALRARAFWYMDKVDAAGDELEALLSDPKVEDPWARDIIKLARLGSGRHPYQFDDNMLAQVEMLPINDSSMLVPVELNGEKVIAMIATGNPDVVIDSSSGMQSDWISLRFGRRLEINDVPAVARDLSKLNKRMPTPIKLLIGTNLLRRANATIDRAGRQLVLRNYQPPQSPQASVVPAYYLRGGGLVLRAHFGAEDDSPAVNLIAETSNPVPVLLYKEQWDKIGLNEKPQADVPGMPGAVQALTPYFSVGTLEIEQMPVLTGVELGEQNAALRGEVGGIMGSGVIASFRMTFAQNGRRLWVEDLPWIAYESDGRPADEVDAASEAAGAASAPATPAGAAE